MKSTLLFALFLLPQLAFAYCNYGEETDLRKIHPSVYRNLPVYNQGQNGTCYAYTGAHLVDFFRIKAGGVSTISPLEAGVLSKVYTEGHGEDGGNTCEVVNALNDRGYGCKKSMVQNEYMYKDLGIQVHRELVKVYMPFISKEQSFRPLTAAQVSGKSTAKGSQVSFLKRFQDAHKKISSMVLAKGFQPTDVPTLWQIVETSQRVHIENRWGAMAGEFNLLILEKRCAHARLPIPKPRSCFEERGNISDMLTEIDRAMDKKTPVGIDYCAQFLKNRSYVGIDYSGKTKQGCYAHASVIIGRRSESNGRCSYLIRNSWGNTSYAWPSSNGDVWVSEEALKKNIFGVSVIQ